ncbi:chorismate--pyruvate lyase family protein [Aquabacterium sp.]|uniref:chorismate--pyruvate lyase family protein n=1 Tax=Aquabacterium sp. TaxID=1872578 RepID=UPI003D6D8316
MLPRSAAPSLSSHRAARHKGLRREPHPASPSLHAWLMATGSLTARLRAHGRVEVQVQRQGSQRLWPEERRDLRCRSGHVREVILLLNGVPVVWARSATSHRALQGTWKALTGLGTRPLAELLFQRSHVGREPLRIQQLTRHGRAESRLRAAWPGTHPRWARSSVFWQHGQALRVMESFAPWIARLDAHRLIRTPG